MTLQGLALGGGGARGSYEIGVWQGLKEVGWEAQIVTGTSVGALNGALIAQGNYDVSKELWLTIETEKIIQMENGQSPDEAAKLLKTAETYLKSMSGEEKGLNTAPLGILIDNYIDEKKVRSSKIDFGLVTNLWEAPKLTPLELFLEDIPQGYLADYLLASSSLFPALQAHVIDGKSYVDGGYYDNVPINMALKRGANLVLAVDLDAVGFSKEPQTTPDQEVRRIKPYWDLGPVLNFNRKTAARNIKLGYLDTLKAFGKAKGCYFTFSPEAFTPTPSLERLEQIKELISREEKGFLQNLATESITKSVERKYRGSLKVDKDLWQICAECAGEVFKVDPEKVYGEAQFIAAVNSRVQEYKLQAKIYDNFGFSKGQSLKKKLKFADAPGKALLLDKYLEDSLAAQAATVREAAALVFPTEFFAAAFLRVANITS